MSDSLVLSESVMMPIPDIIGGVSPNAATKSANILSLEARREGYDLNGCYKYDYENSHVRDVLDKLIRAEDHFTREAPSPFATLR